MQQLELVHRYLERIRDIRRGIKANQKIQINHEDDVLVFFVQCHHMYDWLCAAPNAQGVISRKEVAEFINSHEELRVCADICNWAKHSKVNNNRTGTGLTAFRTLDMQLRGDKDIVPLLLSSYCIECGGKKYDAFDLAEKCYELWHAYVEVVRSRILASKT